MMTKLLQLAAVLVFLWGALPAGASSDCGGTVPSPQSLEAHGINFEIPDTIQLDLIISHEVEMPSQQLMADIVGREVKVNGRKAITEIMPPESYNLSLTANGATISAPDYRGLIYSLQTLAQLTAGRDTAECVTIADSPRCGWRGFMLDSGRQWQPVACIKKYINMASMLKINRFHWHLTEGLGWRPEIKAYPLLTTTGANVGSGRGQQGYYSREDMRELVEYASQRGVEIVPEIDMPGHSEAALISYPWAACYGDSIKVPETGFTDNIFCAGKDTTIAMLRTILDEICEIFPSEYIHLGGDEAPKGNWDKCPECRKRISENGLKDSHDLQLWFAAQMADHLKSKGRKAIFWDDVVGSPGYGLPDNCAVQWWNFRRNGDIAVRNALKLGHEVILSPNYYNYLNFPVTPWAGYNTDRTFGLEDAYLRNPITEMLQEENPKILGATCALWTDYGVTEDMIDSRLFPRILAIAQRMWHKGEELSYEEMCRNIDNVRMLFESRGFGFGPADKKQSQEFDWSRQ